MEYVFYTVVLLIYNVVGERHRHSSRGIVWNDRPFQNFQLEILEWTIIPDHSRAEMAMSFSVIAGNFGMDGHSRPLQNWNGDVVCDKCYRTSSSGFVSTLTCSYGCCGSSSTRYCCPSSRSAGGSTAGTVVGVLVVVSIIIIIVFLCKRKRYYRGWGRGRGQVATHQVTSVQVSHTTTVGHPPQTYPPMYGSYPQSYHRTPIYGHAGQPPQGPLPGQVAGQASIPGAPLNPGYVPPPPSYTAPPPPYSAPPPPYSEAQNFPTTKY